MTDYTSNDSLINIKLVLEQIAITEGEFVGDFGCGYSGILTFPISKAIGEDGLVYSVDVQERVLNNIESLARINGLDNIRTIWADLEIKGSTKLLEDSLDSIFLVNVLYQTTKPELMFQEALRVLKISGRLIVIDWIDASENIGPPMKARVPKKKIQSLAKQCNMKEIAEFEPGPYHYGFVFEKRF